MAHIKLQSYEYRFFLESRNVAKIQLQANLPAERELITAYMSVENKDVG